MPRQSTPAPGPIGTVTGVAGWDRSRKLLEAAKRVTPRLPPEARAQFAALFSPENLAITVAVLGAWAASHAFGVGEAADLVLLLGGILVLGWQAVRAAEDVWDFVAVAADAKTEADLDRAADHLARAVIAVGVTAIVTLILKAGGKLLGRNPLSARVAAAEGEVIAPPPGEKGPWWKASGFGEDWPGTTVPRGFQIEVGGRTFRVHPNATKHMAEKVGETLSAGELRNPGVWSTSPGARLAEVDYPLSSLAGALEKAAARLKSAPAQRHFFQEGNWELGIDTADNPWVVYHAVPKGK